MVTATPPHPFNLVRPVEFSTFERRQIKGIFKPLPARRFGALHCVADNGKHWTVLGDYEYVQTARAMIADSAVPGPDPTTPWLNSKGKQAGVTAAQASELPLEAFKATHMIEGWPDEWHNMGKVVEVLELSGEKS